MGGHLSSTRFVFYEKNHSDSVAAYADGGLGRGSTLPYARPVPRRGKRNDSRNIRYVIAEIARLKEMEEEACAEILRKNAHEVYHI